LTVTVFLNILLFLLVVTRLEEFINDMNSPPPRNYIRIKNRLPIYEALDDDSVRFIRTREA
jgi:hypothetical protein